MRPVLAVLSVAAVIAFWLPAATAQDPDGEPGCPEANPCEVIIAVDAQGFADVSLTELTAGDWYLVSFFNNDEADHTIDLEGHDLTMTVGAYDIEDSTPFKAASPGTYPLKDTPSNDIQDMTVVEAEEFEGSDGGSGDDEDEESAGTPGLGLGLLVATVAALAIALRRRA
jgi:hypothetical protein